MKSNPTKNSLLKHLLEAQKVSGPLNKSINNSGLGAIKRILTGAPPFLGGERYLLFGTELHYRCLERKKGKWKPFDPEEQRSMIGGVKALMKCKLFTDNYKGAEIEKRLVREDVFGIHAMHGTIDLNNKRKKTIIDLKTTSARTYEEFEKKAIQLAYPRQGNVYLELDGKAKHFYIIGISKKNMGTLSKPYYPIFIFDLNNYEKEKEAAKQEAEFLLTFYKTYGIPLDKYTSPDKLLGDTRTKAA